MQWVLALIVLVLALAAGPFAWVAFRRDVMRHNEWHANAGAATRTGRLVNTASFNPPDPMRGYRSARTRL